MQFESERSKFFRRRCSCLLSLIRTPSFPRQNRRFRPTSGTLGTVWRIRFWQTRSQRKQSSICPSRGRTANYLLVRSNCWWCRCKSSRWRWLLWRRNCNKRPWGRRHSSDSCIIEIIWTVWGFDYWLRALYAGGRRLEARRLGELRLGLHCRNWGCSCAEVCCRCCPCC